jgi:DNA-directed RNA polymerase specialized sigma24 family protein
MEGSQTKGPYYDFDVLHPSKIMSSSAGIANAREQTASLRADRFCSTRWSVVLSAGRGDAAAARAALEKLCGAYWRPLFVFARRLGHGEPDAQDLTQAFFEQFLEKGYIRAADPHRGRFRTFLLTSFRHFLRGEWVKSRAAKRGGGATFVSWEELSAAEQVQVEPLDDRAVEAAYTEQWALKLFDGALARLREEFAAAGKAQQFDSLKPFLSQLGSSADYSRVAERCGTSEGAVAVAVRRLRVRYGELLRAEIADTVVSAEDVEGELQLLKRALMGRANDE